MATAHAWPAPWAASPYGVAKAVQIVGVRVLNCSGSGTTTDIVQGVDWVTANAIKPAVANIEPRRRRQHHDRQRRSRLDRLRRHLRDRGRQRRHTTRGTSRRPGSAPRSPSVPRSPTTPGHRSRTSGPAGHLRPGRGHHVLLVQLEHGHQHHQWHVDGHAARGRRRRPDPGRQPDLDARRCATMVNTATPEGHRPRHRNAQPAALRRRRGSATTAGHDRAVPRQLRDEPRLDHQRQRHGHGNDRPMGPW